MISLVVALDDGEGGGHAGEGERGEQEGDRQAGGVDGQQQRALAAEPETAAAERIAPSVGPMQGVQAIAKAAPATIGPPLPARSISASTCHSRLSRATKREATKSTPIAMIRAPAIFSAAACARCRVGAEAGGGEAEQDEDRREAGDEEQAGAEHAAPAGVVELRRGDPGHRREVAGDERQHAGREEGDDSRREGGEDADSRRRIGAENRGDQDP